MIYKLIKIIINISNFAKVIFNLIKYYDNIFDLIIINKKNFLL